MKKISKTTCSKYNLHKIAIKKKKKIIRDNYELID